MNPDLEKLFFPAQFKFSSKSSDDPFVEGYANVFGNLDHNGDVVRPGAFRKTIQERVAKGLVPFLDSHQWDAAHTIGTVTEACEDHKGLRFRALMSKTASAQEIRQKMLEGHIRRLSIGFAPVRESYERVDQPVQDDALPRSPRKSIVRHLHEVKLFEISAVPIAANEEATITNLKSAVPFQDLPVAGRDREWDAGSAREHIARWAVRSGDNASIDWARYRRAFLWYDRADADQPEAYKLPIADVINGGLFAIPRGIFAAAGTLQGARGGIDLHGDEDAVKEHVERYYEKMSRQFHDESLIAPWKRKSLDSILTQATDLGLYDLAEVTTAAMNLISILTPTDRTHLISQLSATTTISGLTTLKDRSTALGQALTRLPY